MPAFPAVAHVAVTVTDLDRSTQWYTALLGSSRSSTRTRPRVASTTRCSPSTAVSSSACTRFPTSSGDQFDERRTGLDHVAFGLADRGELQKWAARLDELGIHHDGIKDAHYGSGVSFRDPDGIALEFFAPPS